MRRVASVLTWLTRAGILVVAVPLLALQLALYLLAALFVAFVAGLLLIAALTGDALGTAWWHDPLLLLLVLVAGLVAAHLWSLRTGVPLPWHPRAPGDSHGSARFATDAERRVLQTGDGLLIGRDGRTGRLLRYDGPAHLLTLAPTRSGKGVGTVIPNLLLVPRSVLVIDPKGENARVTHEARARFGPVHVLDPFGASGLPSAAYKAP